MSGTKAGAKLTALKNKQLYGEDFYCVIGRKGGSKKGVAKGFALNKDRAKEAGRKGGIVSRRNIVPPEDLVKAWNSTDTIDDISKFFGVSNRYVLHAAKRLRLNGFSLRDRRAGRIVRKRTV